MSAVELLQGFYGSAWESENETSRSATVPLFQFSKWNKAQVHMSSLNLENY